MAPPTTSSRAGASITFLGAAGMVSGSRHLLEVGGSRVLFDCGLFQGERHLREKNWERFPVPADSIDAVVLTHGHIDHSGWLPRLQGAHPHLPGHGRPAWPPPLRFCQVPG
jgi:metallo-beta-lactamase family protein